MGKLTISMAMASIATLNYQRVVFLTSIFQEKNISRSLQQSQAFRLASGWSGGGQFRPGWGAQLPFLQDAGKGSITFEVEIWLWLNSMVSGRYN